MRAAYSGLQGRLPYYGWLVVGTVFLSSAISIGPGYAFGLFIGPLEETFGWQRTAISASLSFVAVGALTAPFLGRFMDRRGARPLMAGALLIMGASFLFRPLMSQLWHWYALSFFQYLAFSGSTTLPAGRLVSIWFRRMQGRVMGLTTMGNNFGGFTIPLMVGPMLAAGSWKGAFMLLAGLTFVIAFLSIVLVREFPSAGASRMTGRVGSAPTLTGQAVGEVIRGPTFYMLGLSLMLGSFTYSAILPQVPDHLITSGMSLEVAARAVSLLALFGMAGKISFGYLSELVTARRMMMVSLSGQAFFIVMMVLFPTPPFAWLAVPLFGLFMGSYGALINLVVQETFGLKHFGSIAGLISLTMGVSGLVGPILAGQSFDRMDSYGPGYIVVAIMFAIGAISLTRVRPWMTEPTRRTT